ncbi:hypothetical protein RhiirA5_435708 [Rhizophagus irregularis]|uniref:Uncharacterized protein n=1 Tax=Rhizophagus irregularis TaxID=588596 RepID=A0A2I1F5X2_9GLOM|nr:hypothetical protein RhiirA5_435708 [Rhizophagus irregularis]PKC66547.1 hypothetical protein RhiirA1_459555 [Rhizophagus irregularis]PKY29778.1 hypothetical protein RhiirB3_446530 [Rhizophagus irregularis]CAB4477623.1 unnamed protein product [Rhizophagus irregularis]CAB5368080.1 unnamed protein product [Rhizophagus irregularis]
MMMIRRRISTIITITTIIKWKEGSQRRHKVKYYRRDTDTLADGDKRNDKDSYYYYYHDHKNVKKDHEVKFYRRDADVLADGDKHDDKNSYYYYYEHKGR